MDHIKFHAVTKLKLILGGDNFTQDNNVEKIDLLKKLFKKIIMCFNVLKFIIIFRMMKVNNDGGKINPEKLKHENVILPKNIDELVFMVANYPETFDGMEKDFYDMVNLPFYKDLYSIGHLNSKLISFIVDDTIDIKKLSDDYIIFVNYIKNLSCDVFNLTSEFEESIIEKNDNMY